ncbi:unnamed protein product [Malus baccata var. baccata]
MGCEVVDRTNTKAILLDMISGALDMSATAIVWTLAEPLRHPRVLKFLQRGLHTVIGMDPTVEGSDLPNLDYLNKVVKESVRFHPVAPLLIPHACIHGGQILNRRKHLDDGRDPSVWSDNLEEFYPEPFKKN